MKRLLIIALFLLVSCSYGNLSDVQHHAPEVWKQAGFEIVGYEGYQLGNWGCFGSTHGGACVWYIVKKIPDNGILYKGYIQRWGGEYHIYCLESMDALKPLNK